MLGSPQHSSSLKKSGSNDTDSLMLMNGELDIEVGQVAFNLTARDQSIIIIVKRFSDAITLGKKLLFPMLANKQQSSAFEGVLARMDTTIYIQNRFFGIFGPKANPILNKLILSIANR